MLTAGKLPPSGLSERACTSEAGAVLTQVGNLVEGCMRSWLDNLATSINGTVRPSRLAILTLRLSANVLGFCRYKLRPPVIISISFIHPEGRIILCLLLVGSEVDDVGRLCLIWHPDICTWRSGSITCVAHCTMWFAESCMRHISAGVTTCYATLIQPACSFKFLLACTESMP